MTWELLTVCEEVLEMVGVSLFVYALLVHIIGRYGSLTVLLNASSAIPTEEIPRPNRSCQV